MQDKKDCKNCKYYIEHYVIATNAHFFPIGGHCVHPVVFNLRGKKRYETRENCEHWEINKELKEKRRKRIKEVMRDMETHLLHISQILDIDEE